MSRPIISETNLSRLRPFSGTTVDDQIGGALNYLRVMERERNQYIRKWVDADFYRSTWKWLTISLAVICAGLVLYIVM